MAYRVYFDNKKPTKDEIEKVTKQFLGEVCTNIEWKKDRFIVDLIGKGNAALNGIDISYLPCNEERWFEICVDRDCIEIWPGEEENDRIADDFTNAISSSLAHIFSTFWEGEINN